MDEMKIRLSTKFMRGLVSKLISRSIYKKYGCKVNVQLNDLDIGILDGETKISTNLEVRLDSKEFMKIMQMIDED